MLQGMRHCSTSEWQSDMKSVLFWILFCGIIKVGYSVSPEAALHEIQDAVLSGDAKLTDLLLKKHLPCFTEGRQGASYFFLWCRNESQKGNIALAAEGYRQMLVLYGNDPDLKRDISFRLLQCLMLLKQYGEAGRLCESLKSGADSREQELSLVLISAGLLQQEKKYDEFEHLLTQRLEQSKGLSLQEIVTIREMIADNDLARGKYAKARKQYQNCLKLNDLDTTTRYRLQEFIAASYCRDQKASQKEVEQAFQHLLNDTKVNQISKIKLANEFADYFIGKKQWGRARGELERILRLSKDDKTARFSAIRRIAWIWIQEKNYEQARKQYEHIFSDAQSTTQERIDALKSSAELFLNQKDGIRAIQQYQRILGPFSLSREQLQEIRLLIQKAEQMNSVRN